MLKRISQLLVVLVLSFPSIHASGTMVKVSTDSVTCNSYKNGKIHVESLSPSRLYTIQLFETNKQEKIAEIQLGSKAHSFHKLLAGSYYILVFSDHLLKDSVSVQVYEPASLKANQILLLKAPSSTASCDGILQVKPSGGTPPYSFRWLAPSEGKASEILENVCYGIYRCEINDKYNCGGQTTAIPIYEATIDKYKTLTD